MDNNNKKLDLHLQRWLVIIDRNLEMICVRQYVCNGRIYLPLSK